MGTSSDFFDTLKGISEHMDLPQELKDMLPAFMDNTGTISPTEIWTARALRS